ncbi:MAG TPA: thiamine diphosphokinase [Candidatus Eisenbergiella merdavium]|uniref:Thiamine diphosphokinase n=1 Tax=Candidatus Eisenbergiella merdavium TaxID=2838551 RepID=A0A9D2SPB3_9FIRM|nr:thiamine diphosphokinase [Candidatus Eisenbergiella merdavium]
MEKTGTCIIVGAGELTVREIPVKEGDFVIAADGGFAYCRQLGVEPDLILGDFDSLDEGNKRAVEAIRQERPERVQVLPVMKDDTDMLAAMKEGLKRGFRSFDIYAAAQGRRLSHTIANIQCLNYLKENGASGRLIEAGETVFLLRDETVEFVKEQKGFLSLFSLGDRAEGVTIRNMKYLLDRATVTNAFPVGVSNEFIGEAGSVTVESGTLLVIVGEM